jgi:hypothetical protein
MFFDDIFLNYNDSSNDIKLYDYEDGFMYGNMFKDEYDSYKNYKVTNLSSNTSKGNLLL